MIERHPAAPYCGKNENCYCCKGGGFDSLPTLLKKMGAEALTYENVWAYINDDTNRADIRFVPDYTKGISYFVIGTKLVSQPDRGECAWQNADGSCELGDDERPDTCAIVNPTICLKQFREDIDEKTINNKISRLVNSSAEIVRSWQDPAVQKLLKKIMNEILTNI